jgi:hypothetical protein
MSDPVAFPEEEAVDLWRVHERLRSATADSGLSQHEIGVRVGYSSTSAPQALSRS